MIVERMQRLQVQQVRPPRAIFARQPRHALPHPIEIGRRPPPRIRLHRHPFGPQREQLGGHPVRPAHHLDIGIAMQQQMTSQRLHQPLPRRRAPHQRQHPRRIVNPANLQRTGARPFGHQPHRPLRHRIAHHPATHLRLIAGRPLPQNHRPGPPGTRQHRPGIPLRGFRPEPFHAPISKTQKPSPQRGEG